MQKRLDPTMERRGKETEDKLHQQYKHLQQEWDTIKQSKSKPRTSRRPSKHSRTMVKHLQLLDNSPGNLMSSLQNRSSPSEWGGGGEWKVRNNDLAIEDILRERKAAIESGKLRGRQLFEEVEVDFAGREEIICSAYWDSVAQDSEVRSVCSYDSDNYHENENIENKEGLYAFCCHCSCYSHSSSLSSSSYMKRVAAVEEEEKVVMVENLQEKKGVVNVEDGYYRRRGVVLMSWIVIGLIVCAISIIKKRSFGCYGDRGDDVILVPT